MIAAAIAALMPPPLGSEIGGGDLYAPAVGVTAAVAEAGLYVDAEAGVTAAEAGLVTEAGVTAAEAGLDVDAGAGVTTAEAGFAALALSEAVFKKSATAMPAMRGDAGAGAITFFVFPSLDVVVGAPIFKLL